MKKFIFILMILLSLSSLLSGCKAKPVHTAENRSTLGAVNNFEGASIVVQKDTVTSTGLTLTFKTSGKHNVIYGEDYSLEVCIDRIWYQVPYAVENGGTFISIGYSLEQGTTTSIDVDWIWLYGKLPDGYYRIIKRISDFRSSGDYDSYTLAAEFSLD